MSAAAPNGRQAGGVLEAARDEGFSSGVIAALAVIYAHDAETIWCEVVESTDKKKLLQHAAHVSPDDWEWAGFKRYANRNGFGKPAALATPAPQAREAQMVTVRTINDEPTVWCDPEIADLVDALNTDKLATIASCSGHGHRPGSIALKDGRWLFIATEKQRQIIDAAFPLDINGNVRPAYPEQAPEQGAEQA